MTREEEAKAFQAGVDYAIRHIQNTVDATLEYSKVKPNIRNHVWLCIERIRGERIKDDTKRD